LKRAFELRERKQEEEIEPCCKFPRRSRRKTGGSLGRHGKDWLICVILSVIANTLIGWGQGIFQKVI
jgi:hypothetical protein